MSPLGLLLGHWDREEKAMDYFDDRKAQIRRATGSAKRMATHLKEKGFDVQKVSEATQNEDAEIVIGDGSVTVQASCDGRFSVIRESRQGFLSLGDYVSTYEQVVEEIRAAQAKLSPSG